MGMVIHIGQPELCFDAEVARATIKTIQIPGSPFKENDSVVNNTNRLDASYSCWLDTLKQTNLVEVFCSELGANSESCYRLEPEVLENIKEALQERVRKYPNTQIDSLVEPNFDLHRARLAWLEFTVSWAMENCKYPAINMR